MYKIELNKLTINYTVFLKKGNYLHQKSFNKYNNKSRKTDINGALSEACSDPEARKIWSFFVVYRNQILHLSWEV